VRVAVAADAADRRGRWFVGGRRATPGPAAAATAASAAGSGGVSDWRWQAGGRPPAACAAVGGSVATDAEHGSAARVASGVAMRAAARRGGGRS